MNGQKSQHRLNALTSTEIIVLGVFGVVFFLGINTYVGNLQNADVSLYIPGTDSTSYKNVADWLFQKRPIEAAWVNVAKRPFFFPLILGISAWVHTYFIVLLQFLLWLATLVLVFQILKSRMQSQRAVTILAVCYGTLISPVAITVSVMTETLAIFLITGAVFEFNQYHFGKQPKSLFRGLAFLAFLSVTKPVGATLFVFALVWVLWILQWKPRAFLVSFLVSIPIVIQIAIMVTNFGLARISIAGPYNLDVKYLVRVRALAENRQIPKDPAGTTRFDQVARHKPFADLDLNDYLEDVNRDLAHALRTNPLSCLKTPLHSLVDNVCSGSNYLEVHRRRPLLYFLSMFQTILMTAFGLVFAVITIFLLAFKVVRSGTPAVLKEDFVVVFLIFTLLFILGSSSICYWQGDRLLMLSYSSILLLIALSFEEMKLIPTSIQAS